jgi:ABC-type nitrate/sulfonate/bicarbonate transport system substrate-binding protein
MSAALTLGFIALNDCAPLVVALEKGFFAEEGLSVDLQREASWATVRDKVAIGALDGAHMLAPFALAAGVGVAGETPPLIAPLALNLNGAAVTVSNELARALKEFGPAAQERPLRAALFAELIARRRAAGRPALTFGVVYPFSIHNYAFRYWMAAGGIDPERDVRLVVVPPARTAERLGSGELDGFCVTAPWAELAVELGIGEPVLRLADIWRLCPDKVFGVRERWAMENPAVLQALVRALLRAALWADDVGNRPELVALLSRPDYLNIPARAVEKGLVNIFYSRNAASFPFASHALWFLTQMRRWGHIEADVDMPAVARRVYRADLYRQAAAALGLPAPLSDSKVEGAHIEPWSLPATFGAIPMAPDVMFDGRVFDPADLHAYTAGFEIARP